MADNNTPRPLDDLLVTASAPCRVDLCGTLDISSLYLPLRRYRPCTFNIALDLRTRVRIGRYRKGWVCISSSGFDTAAFPWEDVPFMHPMGLLFAVAAYYGRHGVHIDIESRSPPRSGLGGSSVAAVALIAAFEALESKDPRRNSRKPGDIARLAHAIESAVAGVPCGIQDQLAAAFGGVNAWQWPADGRCAFRRRALDDALAMAADPAPQVLVAYCGTPHDSKDINAGWIRQFLKGESRRQWIEIIDCGNHFVKAIRRHNLGDAVAAMNRETDIRIQLTPDVLLPAGYRLVETAREFGCAGRFTGAGGGGCIWALGTAPAIARLRESWNAILESVPTARVLDAAIDPQGVCVHSGG